MASLCNPYLILVKNAYTSSLLFLWPNLTTPINVIHLISSFRWLPVNWLACSSSCWDFSLRCLLPSSDCHSVKATLNLRLLPPPPPRPLSTRPRPWSWRRSRLETKSKITQDQAAAAAAVNAAVWVVKQASKTAAAAEEEEEEAHCGIEDGARCGPSSTRSLSFRSLLTTSSSNSKSDCFRRNCFSSTRGRRWD